MSGVLRSQTSLFLHEAVAVSSPSPRVRERSESPPGARAPAITSSRRPRTAQPRRTLQRCRIAGAASLPWRPRHRRRPRSPAACAAQVQPRCGSGRLSPAAALLLLGSCLRLVSRGLLDALGVPGSAAPRLGLKWAGAAKAERETPQGRWLRGLGARSSVPRVGPVRRVLPVPWRGGELSNPRNVRAPADAGAGQVHARGPGDAGAPTRRAGLSGTWRKSPTRTTSAGLGAPPARPRGAFALAVSAPGAPRLPLSPLGSSPRSAPRRRSRFRLSGPLPRLHSPLCGTRFLPLRTDPPRSRGGRGPPP